MYHKDGSIDEDFVALIDEYMPLAWMDRDFCVVHGTQAFAQMHGADSMEAIRGQPLGEIQSNMLADHPEWVEGRMVNPDEYANKPVSAILKPVALEAGMAVTWLWLVDPTAGKLARVTVTLRYFKKDDIFGLVVNPIDDPTHKSFIKLFPDGDVEAASGGRFSEFDMRLIDAFMSGGSQPQMAKMLDCTQSMVKRSMSRIVHEAGFSTAADLRDAIWAKHAEEFMISPKTTAPRVLGGKMFKGI